MSGMILPESKSQDIDHDFANDEISHTASTNDIKRGSTTNERRAICPGCRQMHVCCLCAALPHPRIRLLTSHVLVVQHPHEVRHKNRSLPILEHCLEPENMSVTVARNLEQRYLSPAAYQAIHRKVEHGLLWLIFPHPDAIPLSQALLQLTEIVDNEASKRAPKVTLLVFDATWTYGAEMDRNNVKHDLYPAHMQRIQIDDDAANAQGGLLPPQFLIRHAPSERQWSTAEAVAWTLSHVEQAPIYETVLRPLQLLVQHWQRHTQQAQQVRQSQPKRRRRGPRRNKPTSEQF